MYNQNDPHQRLRKECLDFVRTNRDPIYMGEPRKSFEFAKEIYDWLTLNEPPATRYTTISGITTDHLMPNTTDKDESDRKKGKEAT